jgi:methyltransferase (TIGR00027 family)
VATIDRPAPRPPSRTAIWTAISRAIGAKHPDPAFRNPDDLAAAFVGPDERALLPDYPTDALDLDFAAALARLPDPYRVTHMFASTRFFDAALEDGLRGGARQVVVLGAGLDTRGYRFADRLGGVRFFEVDGPSTQAFKRERVAEVLGRAPAHVRYVPVDLASDDLLAALRAHGYAAEAVTVFLWEGVSMYLPAAAVRATLWAVRSHAAPGSVLAFNYVLSRSRILHNPASRGARWGEPAIFGFPGDSAADDLARAGLAVVADQPQAELMTRYARRRDGTWALPAPEPGARDALGRYCVARVPPGT